MKHTDIGLIRPNYEATQFLLCLLAAAVYTAAALLFSSLMPAALVLAALFAVLGLSKLRSSLQHARFERKLLGEDRAACSYSQLKRMLEREIPQDAIWIGDGFTWEPQHRQMVHEIQNLNWAAFFNDAVFRRECLRLLRKPGALIQHPFLVVRHLRNLKHFVTLDQGQRWIHALGENSAHRYLLRKHIKPHCIVIGSSGAGKTCLLRLLIAQAILRGEVVIVIDPKGDSDLRKCLEEFSRIAGREFVEFDVAHPERSTSLNVLSNFQRYSEIASRIAEVMPSTGGEGDQFKSMGLSALLQVLAGMELLHESPTLARIYFYLDHRLDLGIAALKAWLTKEKVDLSCVDFCRPQESVFDKLESLCVNQPSMPMEITGIIDLVHKSAEHLDSTISSTKAILARCTQGDLGRLLSPTPETEGFFTNARKLLQRRSVFYLGTDSLGDSNFARLLCALFLTDLAGVSGEQYNFEKLHHPVSLFIDELSEVICPSVTALLSKARGANFSITVATQSLSDINSRTGSEYETDRILANILNRFVMSCSDEATQDKMSKGLPSASIYLKTKSQSETRDSSAPVAQSANVGERLNEQSVPLIEGELFGSLPPGEFFAIAAGKHVEKVYAPLLRPDN